MIIYIEDQQTFDKAIELWFKKEVPAKIKSMQLRSNETQGEDLVKLLEKYAKKKGISPCYTSDKNIDCNLFIESVKSMLTLEFAKQGFPLILYADVIGNRLYKEIIFECSSVEDSKSIHYPDLR